MDSIYLKYLEENIVNRLLGGSCLGVMGEVCKGWKHGVSIVFHSAIVSRPTEVLGLTISQNVSKPVIACLLP